MASESKSSDEMLPPKCDVCKYMHNNKVSEAISFCTVCNEFLCDGCDQTHKGLKATRDHKIVSGSNMPPSPLGSNPISTTMYCEQHKTMPLNVYCVTHDDVICGTCKLTEHRKCTTTYIKQQMTTRKEELDGVICELMDLKKKYESLKNSREQDKRSVKLTKKACLDDLQKSCQKIKDMLDKLEKDLLIEASDIEENITKQIENHVKIADDALNQINNRLKSLEDCLKSQDNDVIFLCMKISNKLKHKYEDALYILQEENHSNEMHFKPNDVITDVLSQLQSLGIIEIKTAPSYNRVSLLNMKVGERREVDVGCRSVFDCTFIGDSHLVLSCGNDGLKLLDKDFKVQSESSIPSVRVARINEYDVIVTQGYMKQLQRVSIFPKMAVKKTLKMDRICLGVEVFNNEIYVTCHDVPGNGEVIVLNKDGELQRKLGVTDGQYMFSGPNFIKVSRDGSKVFISDYDTNKLTCLSQHGEVLYQYTDSELKNATGMYVDDEGTLLVCGGISHNIHMIKHDGRKQKVVLSQKDGVKSSVCISYRPRDGCLVLGLYEKEKPLLVFQTKVN